MTKPSKGDALKYLRESLDAIPQLKELKRNSPEFEKWHRNTRVAIGKIFGDDSSQISDFNQIQFSNQILSVRLSGELEYSHNRDYLQGLNSAKAVLESMIEEVEKYWEDEDNLTAGKEKKTTDVNFTNKDVFIIHGRDNGTKETVARFIEKLGLNPIILHEQANEGRTIIEKFEKHTDVAYAIALLTPDDVGNIKSEQNTLKPRARQNVIFEFGFFFGKLGRKRVCCINKGDVEFPSDYSGVLYIDFDPNEGWQGKLIKELKASELDVDTNLLYK
jgi:predicted nucleotide-binding protein